MQGGLMPSAHYFHQQHCHSEGWAKAEASPWAGLDGDQDSPVGASRKRARVRYPPGPGMPCSAFQQALDPFPVRYAAAVNEGAVDGHGGCRHDLVAHDGRRIRDLFHLDLDAQLAGHGLDLLGGGDALLAAGTQYFDLLHGLAPLRLEKSAEQPGAQQVDQPANDHEVDQQDDEDGGQQAPLHDLLEHDELGEAGRHGAHAEGQGGAHRQPLEDQALHHRDDTGGVGVERKPRQHGDGHVPPLAAAQVLGEPAVRHEAMQAGAQADTDDHPLPDSPDDLLELVPGKLMAILQGEGGRLGGRLVVLGCRGGLLVGLGREVLQPALALHGIEEHAAADAHAHADGDVDQGELPAQQAPQHDHRHLVDDRRGEQEGHGDAQRNPGAGEAQEQRDARAGAEGGDGAEAGAQAVACQAMLLLDVVAHPFQVQRGAHQGDDVDHHHQQREDLGGVFDEEVQRVAELALGVQARDAIDQPVGQPGKDLQHVILSLCVRSVSPRKTQQAAKGYRRDAKNLAYPWWARWQQMPP
ncbi:hypothetical protein HALA3H3_p20048 [Halomonas sp. A3H3]|nr:hypothetical protein HALA3H3_p20048 [Halomonas sp. A3H3]